MRKLLSVAISAIFISTLLVTPQVNASSAATLTPAASAAFSDVGRCLASGKTRELSVYYLIDNSGSLRITDPKNLRQEILAGSIEELASFIDQDVSVEVAAAFFSSGVQPVLGWNSLQSSEDARELANNISDKISNDLASGNTDWEKGLSTAYQELTSRGDRCKMLIWFTDGGINPPSGGESGLFNSLSALCRAGISDTSLGQSGSYGLMSQFRKSQIPVFGVLYSNLEAAYEAFRKDYPDEADDLIASERWRMSFMQALVEGRGQIASETSYGVTLPSGELQCARVDSQGIAVPEEVNGAYLNASDPVALAYQFLKLGTQISGGAGSTIVDGKFSIPPGTAKFVVTVYGDQWSLKGPTDSGISASNANQSSPIKSRQSAGTSAITVEVVGNPSAYGNWEIETNGKAAELFLYPGLTLSLDRDKSSKILSDYPNTITGKVVRTEEFAGNPIDLSEFEQNSISVAYLSGDNWMTLAGTEVSLQSNGQFAISNFSPPASQDLLEVQLTLALGEAFNPVESRFTLEVQDKLALTRAATDNLRLSNLVGPQGIAEGTLVLQGPNTSESSEFCFAELIRIDDSQTGIEKIDRYSSFDWKFIDQASGAEATCFTVAKDQELSVLIQARNSTQAPSEVVSVWRITSTTSGAGVQFEAPIKISFTSEVETNQLVTWIVLALLTALGLLVPLGSMWLLNFFTTRFLDISSTTKASFPVKVDVTGSRTLITDARPGSSGQIVVGPRDFTSLMDEKAPRSFDTGQGIAQARIPLFPLNATWYEWQAPQGSRVVSPNLNASKSTKQMKQFAAAEISPNMADNWALVFTDSELQKQDKSSLSANLIVFARAGNISSYEERIKKIQNTNGLDSSIKLASESAQASHRTDPGDKNGKNAPLPPTPLTSSGVSAPPIPGFGGGSVSSNPLPPSQKPAGPPIPGFGNNPTQNNNGPKPPPWLPGQDRK